MKELRIEHKKNEHLIFGKTNPIRADEGSIKVTSTGAASIGSAGAGACTTEAVVVDVRRSNDAAVENVENTIAGAAHSVGRWPANRRPRTQSPDTTRKHVRSGKRYGLEHVQTKHRRRSAGS